VSVRDPDVRLYDAACQLLVAAQLLRETAEEAGDATAIAPTLGCLQAALEELELGVATLPAQLRAEGRRLRGALDDLAAMLRLARRAADTTRAAAAEAPESRARV
jgi:hypothetical protein